MGVPEFLRAGELRVARQLRSRRSVIVGGHGVGDLPPGTDPENLCVPVARFRAQVELLLEAGFELVTVAELARAAAGRPAPPPGLAALSFDDGMDNNLTVLAPLLREYGIPATVYVITGLIGEPNPWLAPGLGARMLTGPELLELQAAGVELGAHTVSHPDMATLDHAACLAEARNSRDALEALTGRPPATFAYPFCRFSPAAARAVQDAGFEAAVSGLGMGSWAPYELDRAMITGIDGTPSFLAKLGGIYQPLFDSRGGRAARVVSRRSRRAVRGLRARTTGAGRR